MQTNLYLWLIPLLPLLGAAINGFLGRQLPKRGVVAVGIGSTALSLAWVLYVATRFAGLPDAAVPHIENYFVWIRAGDFEVNFGFWLDQLSMLMVLIVTGVGFLIHIYSVGYMWEEGGFYRFFSYLNLFMFFMLTLVLANNYLLLFVGWEGVGLASYLLIGFFFRRDSAANAGMKAFVVNRIGDLGFLIALFLMIKYVGSLNFDEAFRALSHAGVEDGGAGVLTAIGLCLLAGAAGKSAQLPLYVWLPDAMEGPTPVSALIHAATMVTAGVYMIARSHMVFDRAPIALTVVAIIGCATALFAATIGIVQHDIKRVLAYSTVSQLGYMVLACGVAAYSAAMFHLMTHAFFKALLFLGAGSVIHSLGGEQDMRKMGGLRKQIPWTFWTMTAATLAIAGAPGFSGFFSKDEILWRAFSSHYGSWGYWAVGLFTAFLTAFYMFRLWFLTFFGEYRGASAHDEHAGREQHTHSDEHAHHGHAHESPPVMLAPLVVLALLSVVGGWIGIPAVMGGGNHFEKFLAPVMESGAPHTEFAESTAPKGETRGEPAARQPEPASNPAEPHGPSELMLSLAATFAALLGFLGAWWIYFKQVGLADRLQARFRALYDVLEHKYWVDEIYNAAIVRPLIAMSTVLFWRGVDTDTIDATLNNSARGAQGVSDVFRRMQSGNIRSYAGWVAAGAAAVVIYMAWSGGLR
jgi:NADH-quinone oxidoreductase subunit L